MKTDALFLDLKGKNNIKVIENTEESIINEFEKRYVQFKDKFFYEQFLNCGGIIIDNWIRLNGCGLIKEDDKNESYNINGEVDIIIGEDILGGLFALKSDIVLYYAPDTNSWESLDIFYTQFLNWLVNHPNDVNVFYEKFRWNTWKNDCQNIKDNEGYSFYPLLQNECNIEERSRKVISIDELIRFNLGI